jgi:hypothetical protein
VTDQLWQQIAVVTATGFLAGLLAGATAALLLLRFADTRLVGWLLGCRQRPGGGRRGASVIDLQVDADTLSEIDRREVAADFAEHAVAVQQQLARYADQLADGDASLRERLRRVEGGVRW